MSAGALSELVLAIAVIALVAAGGMLLARRLSLRRELGTEYEQLARELGGRRARAEIVERRRRVAGLGIKPLTAEQQASYVRQWDNAQSRFIDDPAGSVRTSAGLVISVAADRGYPVTDTDRLLADLSVHHARRLPGYRQARKVTQRSGEATTEQLRQALLGHRALFRELAGIAPAGPAGHRKALSWPWLRGSRGRSRRQRLTSRTGPARPGNVHPRDGRRASLTPDAIRPGTVDSP